MSDAGTDHIDTARIYQTHIKNWFFIGDPPVHKTFVVQKNIDLWSRIILQRIACSSSHHDPGIGSHCVNDPVGRIKTDLAFSVCEVDVFWNDEREAEFTVLHLRFS